MLAVLETAAEPRQMRRLTEMQMRSADQVELGVLLPFMACKTLVQLRQPTMEPYAAVLEDQVAVLLQLQVLQVATQGPMEGLQEVEALSDSPGLKWPWLGP